MMVEKVRKYGKVRKLILLRTRKQNERATAPGVYMEIPKLPY